MDASKYLTNAGLSRSETLKLSQAINEARTPAERYENAVARLTAAKAAGAIQTGTFIRLMDEEKRKLDALNASTVKQTASTGQLASQLKGLVAGYVGLQTITKSISLAVSAEQAAVSFEILTGSLNDAKILVRQVTDFAKISPVTLEGANKASTLMLSFGVAAKDVARNLKMLGDISGGNQEKFDRLVYVFSQMTTAGRLMGQDLKQMVEAGFNPLKQMSDETGESLESLRQKMEDGQISSDMVTEAFIRATSEGGRFHGMTERMAETMGGKLAIAMANLDLALQNIGKAMAPLVITMTDGMNDGTSAVDGLTGSVGLLSNGLALTTAVYRDMINTIKADLSDPTAKFRGLLHPLEAINNFLDLMHRKEVERLTEIERLKLGPQVFEEDFNKPGPMHGPEFTKEIKEEIDKANKVAIHKANMRMLEAIEVENDMFERLEKEEKARIDLERKLGREALKHADEHFKRERENAKRLQDDIAKGPQSIEAGSADAAKYMAEQANAAIAANMGLDQPMPTEEELLKEAQRQSVIMEEQAANEARQVDLLQKLLEKKPDVGRIR